MVPQHVMRHLWLSLLGFLACLQPLGATELDPLDFTAPPHRYHERIPNDPFTRLKGRLESGEVPLDRSSELGFLRSLLRVLGIPESSQLLVFSTTSLQLGLISPSNPRALYFNEDTYVGWVPGGRIEIVSIDPELGAIFYIFDIPRDSAPIRAERSGRCMNCHAGEDAGFVPGLVVKSVLPGPSGGSLDSFRLVPAGHAVPFETRFGGWHLTGANGFSNHWGNLTGRLQEGTLVRIPNPLGDRFRLDRYPVPTSDFVAHCVHEHQIGYFNRAIAAGYRVRTYLQTDGSLLKPAHQREVDANAEELVRYLLLADEAPFPSAAIRNDTSSGYRRDFAQQHRVASGAASLKDLDLTTHLFRHHCSYLIHSAQFQSLPALLRDAVIERIRGALRETDPDSKMAPIDDEERRFLRTFLSHTVPGFKPEGANPRP